MAVWWKPVFFLPLFFVSALSASRPITGRHSGSGLIVAYDNPAFVEKNPGVTQSGGIRNVTILTMPKVPNEVTTNLGESKVENENVGGAAPMQLQLLPDNKIVWFDSKAILYDPPSASHVNLKVVNDPSSTCGGLAPNGDLVSIGGSNKAIRILAPGTTAFRENPTALADKRSYSSMVMLDDGSFMVLGGRKALSYEIVPSKGQLNFPQKLYKLPFTAPTLEYPFLHLLPDGNVFVFANTKSVILNPKTGKVVRTLPDLAGGSRTYPTSGMSALLPLDLAAKTVKAEVIVCGGSSADCNRLVVTNPNAKWETEAMPSPRVGGDMLILPNGELLMINGAKKGQEPNLTPVLYNPDKPKGQRMKVLAPTKVARMTNSAAAVLQNGEVLLAGNNKVEKFTPPNLNPEFWKIRPIIAKANSRTLDLKYDTPFEEHIRLKVKTLNGSEIKATLYAPPFTTHGFSMNQRLVSLPLTKVSQDNIKAIAPASSKVAPPGKYLLSIVYRGVPSAARWITLS